MGFFSKIGDVFNSAGSMVSDVAKSPFGVGVGTLLGGPVGGILGGLGSSLLSSTLAGSAASSANSYQTSMSNTSHQREVADLRAAGLNPILSANAGASSPSGHVAQTPNIASDRATLMQANAARSVAASQIEKQAAETAFTRASTAKMLPQIELANKAAAFIRDNPRLSRALAVSELAPSSVSSAGGMVAMMDLIEQEALRHSKATEGDRRRKDIEKKRKAAERSARRAKSRSEVGSFLNSLN